MNPLSSIPPTPSGDQSSHLKKTVPPSPGSAKDVTPLPLSPPMDPVSLSVPIQEVSSYLEHLSQIPDVRQTRIAQIQRAIESHEYLISPEDVADKILQELPSQSPKRRPPTGS